MRVVALLLLTSLALRAQTLVMSPMPHGRTSIDVRFMHILPNKGNAPLSDGTLDISLCVPTAERFSTVVSMSCTNDSRVGGGPTILPGNLFIGMQMYADTSRRTVATLGLYLPTASKANSSIPEFVNRYEIQRYVRNHTTAYLNVAGRLAQGNDVKLNGEVGTTYLAASESSDTSTVMIHYGVGGVVGSRDVKFTFEFTGLVNFASSFSGLSDRFLHFIGLGVTFMGAHVQPGMMIQLPLNQSLRGVVDGALGMRVGVVM